MRRVSAIPEDIDLDMGDSAPPDGQDLRMLVDELKDVMAAERPGERALVNSARELTRMAGALSEQSATAHSGPKLRLGVFVDTANVSDRDPDDPIRLDFKKLLDEVTADRRLIHARAYCPIYADFAGRLEHQRSVAPVWDKGYDIVTKSIKVFADGTRKADLDIVLVMDVIRRLPTMDVVALVSGDGDYVPMVDYLREHGLRVEAYSFSDAISEDLRVAANHWSDLSSARSLHVNSKNGTRGSKRVAVRA
jgi:uncharacterized LabA/DUF88 family protein